MNKKRKTKTRQKSGSGIKWIILIMITAALIGFSIFIMKRGNPTTLPKVGKVSQEDYKLWLTLCDAVLSSHDRGDINVMVKKFMPDFLWFCNSQYQQISQICKNNKSDFATFVFICRSIGEAQAYYISHQRETETERSIFPVDLLPEDYQGEIPETQPVFDEEAYKALEKSKPILAHNLKLYEQERIDIDDVVRQICWLGEEIKEEKTDDNQKNN